MAKPQDFNPPSTLEPTPLAFKRGINVVCSAAHADHVCGPELARAVIFRGAEGSSTPARRRVTRWALERGYAKRAGEATATPAEGPAPVAPPSPVPTMPEMLARAHDVAFAAERREILRGTSQADAKAIGAAAFDRELHGLMYANADAARAELALRRLANGAPDDAPDASPGEGGA